MRRNPEYQQFLDFQNGIALDNLPADQETVATKREIGWWKQQQIQKAIHAARYEVATPEQLELLKKKKIEVDLEKAKARTKRYLRVR